MGDKKRNFTNEAMEQIIGNMTAEMQNTDGQYVPLAFTPPPTTEMNWNQPQNSYINHFGVHSPEPMMNHPTIDPYNPNSYNYIPPPANLFDPSPFKTIPINDYEQYKPIPNGGNDLNLLDRFILSPSVQNIPDNILNQPQSEPPHPTNHTLIDNLVGNWVIPNNSGTYSPFGTETFKPSVFEVHPERDNIGHVINNHQFIDEPKYVSSLDQSNEDKQFSFNRDHRKPRMVAEVKPMRPSYSDVLTKPVPLTTAKPLKNDVKETKPKKENKKTTKNDKSQKSNNNINRTLNNDIKDLNVDKSQFTKSDKNVKTNKANQMPRKWASLDNIADPSSTKTDDKKKKSDDKDKNYIKQSKKVNKTVSDITDIETVPIKTESLMNNKNGVKKIVKPIGRPKPNDSFANSERPPGKRNQRTRKRETHVPFGFVGQKLKQYTKGWWRLFMVCLLWLFNLVSDICSLSIHISRDLAVNSWSWMRTHGSTLLTSTADVFKRIKVFTWLLEKFKGKKKEEETEQHSSFAHNGLQNNINMPTTGDEAMRRLLACKGKDPYSILGVTPTCTDDDIKRYYKRQAFLVHPDKNPLPGAEEAFKILVHAFDMIGEPERRAAYDRGVVESAQVVQAWSELNDLLQQLQQKVEAAANTIRCSACGFRHKRIKIDRPSYAARNCNQCKIHHAAREGDIWAEAKVLGFLWHYYACMEGAVYDITEWAGCQKESLKHLKPDSHHVQYRIALGKQNNPPRRHSNSPRTERPDLENLLNTLYGQNDNAQGTRRRSKKANK